MREIESSSWLIETVVDDGVIASIKPSGVFVALSAKTDSCENTGIACEQCSQCAPTPSAGETVFVAITTADFFCVNQPVRVKRTIPTLLASSLTALGIPTAMALAVLCAWYLRSPRTVESYPAIGLSAFAFCAGFGFVKIIDTFFHKHFPPRLCTDARQ
jgi:hypothetical protein